MSDIRQAFDKITATDEMKEHTRSYLSTYSEGSQKPTVLQRLRAQLSVSGMTRAAALAASVCCLVIFAGAGGYTVYRKPVSYISIDVNPSLELGLNYFRRVVDVRAFNEEADEIVEAVNVKGKYYTDAVDTLVSDSKLSEYLEGDYALTFTVVGKADDNDEVSENLEKCVNRSCHRAEYFSAGKEEAEEAHQIGMSAGKYRAYQELLEYDDSVSSEECQNMSMHEIRNRTEECRRNHAGRKHGEGNHAGDHEGENQTENGNTKDAGRHGNSSGTGMCGNGRHQRRHGAE